MAAKSRHKSGNARPATPDPAPWNLFQLKSRNNLHRRPACQLWGVRSRRKCGCVHSEMLPCALHAQDRAVWRRSRRNWRLRNPLSRSHGLMQGIFPCLDGRHRQFPEMAWKMPSVRWEWLRNGLTRPFPGNWQCALKDRKPLESLGEESGQTSIFNQCRPRPMRPLSATTLLNAGQLRRNRRCRRRRACHGLAPRSK